LVSPTLIAAIAASSFL